MNPTIQKVQYNLENCYKIYETYKYLVDAYVLNFYTENNWEKLPNSWREGLDGLDPKNLAKILKYNEKLSLDKVLPLSLLVLRKLVYLLDVPRKATLPNKRTEFNEKVEKLLWKHVKPKKRHEISTMANFTHENAKKTNCFCVVDIGSGLGHLCRNLAYKYGMRTLGIEVQEALGTRAKEIDEQFETFIKKYPGSSIETVGRKPVHITMRLEEDIEAGTFVKIVSDALNLELDETAFGIVALHACGNLSTTLVRLYKECPNVRFLNIVGCCYMKLTCDSSLIVRGFPLSTFSNKLGYTLTYNSREVACHAIENYIERLESGLFWQLKIHAFRALLEKILKENRPDLCQTALCNVKYTEDLNFHDYCSKALKKSGVSFQRSITEAQDIVTGLKDWDKVVIFYSLRLLLAPLIESIVLYDRFLFLLEHNSFGCDLVPAFDPKLSPRNHILSANKNFVIK